MELVKIKMLLLTNNVIEKKYTYMALMTSSKNLTYIRRGHRSYSLSGETILINKTYHVKRIEHREKYVYTVKMIQKILFPPNS